MPRLGTRTKSRATVGVAFRVAGAVCLATALGATFARAQPAAADNAAIYTYKGADRLERLAPKLG